MKIAPRGKFKTLVHDDGSPVVYHGTAVIANAPRLVQGKTYATLTLDDPEFCAHIDREIREAVVGIEYSPLRNDACLVIKVAPNALVDPDLAVLDAVEVHMKLGNFGTFGYCWVASRLFRRRE